MMAFIVPGASFGGGDRVYDLIAEDGEHIASHVCSSPGWAPDDLWNRREERQREFAHKGITHVVFLADSDVTAEELLQRNREWAEAEGITEARA